MYNGKDKDKLRIETICTNKFKAKQIGEVQQFGISVFLKPLSLSKFSKGIGNSYCNLISYKIMELIGVRYSFIHIPKEFNAILAVRR